MTRCHQGTVNDDCLGVAMERGLLFVVARSRGDG